MTNFDSAYVEHQRRGQKPTDDWQTPPHILKVLGRLALHKKGAF